jgi:uncharacterized protein YdaU (DUF1376 family)
VSKKRWFRLYIERWRDGTFGLTPNEIAAYITIICELYDNEGFLIDPDFDLMARRCGMRPTSFRKALDVLIKRGKLTLEGDCITSKAVSEEIKSREKLDEMSAESRRKLAGKTHENNEVRRKLGSNTEERIQNSRLREVGAVPDGRDLPPAVAAFVKRRAVRGRQ